MFIIENTRENVCYSHVYHKTDYYKNKIYPKSITINHAKLRLFVTRTKLTVSTSQSIVPQVYTTDCTCLLK